MRIDCLNGFFQYRESMPGEINKFISLFGFDLVQKDDYYTHSFLLNAENYSLDGQNYLGLVATKTFEGNPWDIFKENNFVYDFNQNQIKLINQISKFIVLQRGSSYYLTNGLIMPGSITDGGYMIRNYRAWYDFKTSRFKYSGVEFE